MAGGRVAKYSGPISADVFTKDQGETSVIGCVDLLLTRLSEKAIAVDSNAVIGVEFTIDPYASRGGNKGLSMVASGTAALIEWPE